MKKITVLIPCYNESEAIATVIGKLPFKKAAQNGFKLDILVIDNNSSDATAEIAREAGARVILEKKQGKGNAIRTGFYNIPDDSQYVIMLDGDDTYNAGEMLRLIEPIDAGFAKVIIGSRMHGKMGSGAMKRFNKFGNHMYSSLVRSTYNVTVTDVLTGYYAWHRDVVVELRPHLRSQGFAIEMEMVTKMARLGYEIYSVPISYHPRLGESSLNPIYDGTRILSMYMRNLRWKPSATALETSSETQQEVHKQTAENIFRVGMYRRRHENEANDSSVRI